MTFDKAFTRTVGLEDDFSDDANDSGGATRFGITEAVARANGYGGDMRELPFDLAKNIARRQYWDTLRLDDIAILSEPVAAELFDTSYNMGTGTAGKFLQRALNIFNRQGKDYPDLVIDGIVGPGTLFALRTFANLRGADGEAALLRALNDQQGVRYMEIAERNPSQEGFEFGWFLKRVS